LDNVTDKTIRSASRRRFIHQTAALGAAALIPPLTQAQDRRVERVGLQLYTLRREMAENFDATLARVADLGFKEMEFAGYFGRSATDVRRVLERNGLTSPAAHIQLTAVRSNLQGEIDYAAELGQTYIVIPSLPGDERSLDDYKRHAQTLNSAGEAARRAGLKMGYHNHDFEFAQTGGQTHYDVLLNETDPELVDFEMDLFWINVAGSDPLAYFASHPGRFTMLHVKDRDTHGRMADVGLGTIDFAGLFSNVDTAGFRHYFVEHDNPGDGLASVANSIYTVRNLRF
jgi:sugar phosphate isomerase/epimerase